MLVRKKHCQCAVNRFGYTNNPEDAGYIMPNGKMLDFQKYYDLVSRKPTSLDVG